MDQIEMAPPDRQTRPAGDPTGDPQNGGGSVGRTTAADPVDGPPPPPQGVTIRLVVAMVIAAAIFLAVPEIDLWAAGLFYTPGDGFSFRNSDLGIAYDRWRDLLLIAPLAGFLAWQAARPPKTLAGLLQRGREIVFVILSMLIANGLVVNAIFKENWGRARPHQTEIFGGTKEFTPPLVPTDQCDSNCSFVGGDMGFAFGMIALMLLARHHRGAWLAAVMVYAVFISLLRMAHGAHFLSDGIFAGLFTIAITIGLFHLFLGEGPRARRLRQQTGLASLGHWIADRIARVVDRRSAA